MWTPHLKKWRSIDQLTPGPRGSATPAVFTNSTGLYLTVLHVHRLFCSNLFGFASFSVFLSLRGLSFEYVKRHAGLIVSEIAVIMHQQQQRDFLFKKVISG